MAGLQEKQGKMQSKERGKNEESNKKMWKWGGENRRETEIETKSAKWGFTVKRMKTFSFLKLNSATVVHE